MTQRTKNWLKGCAALVVFFSLLVLVAALRPKPVAYRIYGVEDEGTGGWMIAFLWEGSDPKTNPFAFQWQTADGRDSGDKFFDISLETSDEKQLGILVKDAKLTRHLKLELLAVGEKESRQTGWSCWGHASFLTRESTVLNWQPTMHSHAFWKTLEDQERDSQWKLLDSNQAFGWADWIKSFHPDEPKDSLLKSADQHIAAMGEQWVVLRSCYYDYSGGAHGNFGATYEPHVVEAGRQRVLKIEELFGGKIPWDLLMPHLRKAYADWGKGGSYVDPKDLEKTLRTSASLWPNAVGLTFSYDPYAIAPYSEGAPDLKLPLSAFADAVDWKGPARLIWPKEAARRAKKP